jgi:hypothetical protein
MKVATCLIFILAIIFGDTLLLWIGKQGRKCRNRKYGITV